MLACFSCLKDIMKYFMHVKASITSMKVLKLFTQSSFNKSVNFNLAERCTNFSYCVKEIVC